MTLDINPVAEDGLNACSHFLIVSVANYWNRRFELMYAGSWGFQFAPPGTKGPEIWDRGDLGPRLYYDSGDRLYLFLAMFHGIKMNYCHCTVDEASNFIKKQLSQGAPLIAHIDTYYLPWLPKFYLQIHSTHAILVTGMDESGNLYCNDTPPFLQTPVKAHPLSLEQFKCGYKDYFGTFERMDRYLEPVRCISSVQKKAAELLGDKKTVSVFQLMRQFSQYISEEPVQPIDLEEFGGGSGILIRAIRNIIRDRTNFAQALKYLGEICNLPEYVSLYEEFQLPIQSWTEIRAIFYRSHLMQNTHSQQNKIAEMIKCVAECEENIAHKILAIKTDKNPDKKHHYSSRA